MIPILSDSSTAQSRRFPADLADRCVKCGLCLPQCPTFMLNHEEAESPRGRIGLMQAMAATDDAPGPGLVRHLDQCLACRRCEAVCPAQVPYGQLIDAARAEISRRGRRPPLTERMLIAYSRSPWIRRIAASVLRSATRLGIIAALRKLAPRRLRQLSAMLPTPARARPRPATSVAQPLGPIALFHGCMGPTLEPQTLTDAVSLLTAAGYEVVASAGQNCCGAIALHAGDADAARQLMHRNVAALGAGNVPVAFVASGCGATLVEYGTLIGATGIADRCHDVMYYLAASELRPQAPAGTVIAAHEPCTQRNVVGEHGATMQMLRASGAAVVELPSNDRCCGAAGAYLLRQPGIAGQLVAAPVQAIASLVPTAVATTNVGCAAHIRSGLRAGGLATRIAHPVTLLAEWI